MNIVNRISQRYGFSKDNRHRRDNIRICISVAVCVVAMTMVLSFMQSLANNRIDDIRRYESYDAVIDADSLTKGAEIVAKLQSLPEIESCFVFAQCPALVTTDAGLTLMGRIRFLDINGPGAKKIDLIGKDGSGPYFSYSALMSLSSSLHSVVRITTLKKGKQARVVPFTSTYPIGGVFYTPYGQFNSNTFVMDISNAESFDCKYQVGVYCKTMVEKAVSQINALDPSLHPVTYKQMNASLCSALLLEQVLMQFIFYLMVFVVILSIRTSCKRLLECKQKEIGMLRTMGLEKKRILLIFLRQSLLFSIIGIIAGISLSYLLVAMSPRLFFFLSRYVSIVSSDLSLNIALGPLVLVCGFILVGTWLFSYLGTKKILSCPIMEMLHDDKI